MLKLTNPFLENIRECQKKDERLMEKLVLINGGKETNIKVDENGVMRFRGRMCVPDVSRFEEAVLVAGNEEANF
ncbi:hypothetical protein A2U01_0074246 [Trifolium medium]|uniref:DNA/RNA polymerase superfamily protein n=1 Tax=Trifolium medium TaxID=97028 RepID=A0A392SYR4_9FABA|nr:hypothetical protein [Trifolium medium]